MRELTAKQKRLEKLRDEVHLVTGWSHADLYNLSEVKLNKLARLYVKASLCDVGVKA